MIKNGFRITKHDLKLIHYLHAVKIATTRQIQRDIYPNHSGANTRKRLKKLRDLKYLTALRPVAGQDMSYQHSLSNKAVRFLKKQLFCDLTNKTSKSESHEHDICLVNIRKIFKSKNMVKDYYSENQIQTYEFFDSDEKLNPMKEHNFDACTTLQKQGTDKFVIGLQFEQSQKGYSRYQSIITNYYIDHSIDFIFYICTKSSIELKIKEIEEKVCRGASKKIYFLSYDKLLNSSDELIFRNAENQFIRVT